MQISSTVRSAMADAFETVIGTSARLLIFTATNPAMGATATGTKLCDATLPSDWLTAASSGQKTLSGTWQDSSADASGVAQTFQLFDNALTFVAMQGTISTSTTSDMQFSNTVVSSGLSVTVTSFTLTMPSS
jgi:hypothetical protein